MSKNFSGSQPSKSTFGQQIIGWRENVSLPQLNIDRVKAKIDTGARSSALHAFKIQELIVDNKTIIRFQVHPRQRDDKTIITSEAELLEYRKVKNSGGIAQLRPVVKTVVQLKEQKWTIELTLTNRDVMGFRMLLGRQAVRNKFLVDPGRSFLQSDLKQHN